MAFQEQIALSQASDRLTLYDERMRGRRRSAVRRGRVRLRWWSRVRRNRAVRAELRRRREARACRTSGPGAAAMYRDLDVRL